MRKVFLELCDLDIRTQYQEQLFDLNIMIGSGECHLLWGRDNTPRIAARLFCGTSAIESGFVKINGKIQERITRSIFEKQGIYCVENQIQYIEDLSIAETLFVLKKNHLSKIRLNKKAILLRTQELFMQYELQWDANQCVRELKAVDRVILQLIRLVESNAQMIVLCGISQICDREDMSRLLEILKKIKSKKLSFLIYDRYPEFFASLADIHYLMQGGYLIKKYDHIDFVDKYYDNLERVTLMTKTDTRKIFLSEEKFYQFIWFNKLKVKHQVQISFGEILFIRAYGWEEQQLIIKGLLGIETEKSYFYDNNTVISYRNVDALMKRRVGFWGSDQLETECFFNLSMRENIILPVMKRISHFGFYQRQEEFICGDNELFGDITKIEEGEALTEENIFKVLCYRWKLYNPKLLIIQNILSRTDETLKYWIRKEILDMAKRGTAIILLEAYKEDVLPIADRIITLEDIQRLC